MKHTSYSLCSHFLSTSHPSQALFCLVLNEAFSVLIVFQNNTLRSPNLLPWFLIWLASSENSRAVDNYMSLIKPTFLT